MDALGGISQNKEDIMKTAYLVTITVTTRVIVDTDDEDLILEAAHPRLRDAIAQDGVAPFLDERRFRMPL
jgi:hypothetical protein